MPDFQEKMATAGIDVSIYRAWEVALKERIDKLRVLKQEAIANRQAWTTTRDDLTTQINELRMILDGVPEP
jgi:PIN domain nuclease of toxin-antitoxin system